MPPDPHPDRRVRTVTRKLIIEADGGSRGNPGPAGFGAVVRDQATGELLREICDSIGTATNNVAEYSGLIAALRAAAEISPGADVEARMDSRLVVEQMSGRWQIKHENLRSLARTARDAAAGLGRVRYTWVPRSRNAHADRLANQAMDSAMGEQPAGGGRHGKPRNAKVLSEPDATEPDEAVAAATGASLAVDDGLVEADFGKLEGLTFGEAAQRWPEEMSAWLASADVAPPGGESLADAARRVLGTLDRLLAARPRETLLLVSHVTPIKTLACRALLAPPAAMFRIHLDVASLTEIDWFADGPVLVRSLNDTAHLWQPAR